MWLSNDILLWLPESNGGPIGDEMTARRAYAIWTHAENLIAKDQSSFTLTDTIANLKRAVNHRLRVLNSLYNFQSIPVKNKPKRTLELLGYLGIIRPTMLNSLISIRNELEHEDTEPPSVERCLEFIDVTWYFLRVTDQLVHIISHQFVIHPSLENDRDDHYWLEIDTGPSQNWSIYFRGWIMEGLISHTQHPGWLNIQLEDMMTRKKSRPVNSA